MKSPRPIGAVIGELTSDFPDLTISKLRFLEAQGLISPRRTDAGYRTFSPDDVSRIRYILTAQRDWFWPLRVIREALDALDRGLEPAESPALGARPQVPAAAVDPTLPDAAELAPRDSIRLTNGELGRSARIDADMVAELCTYGLIGPDAAGHFGEDALAVARAAGRLAAYGIQARHLRLFRTAADREVGLVEQVLGARRVRPGARAPRPGEPDGADPAREILAACIGLHVALVRSGLSRGPRS